MITIYGKVRQNAGKLLFGLIALSLALASKATYAAPATFGSINFNTSDMTGTATNYVNLIMPIVVIFAGITLGGMVIGGIAWAILRMRG